MTKLPRPCRTTPTAPSPFIVSIRFVFESQPNYPFEVARTFIVDQCASRTDQCASSDSVRVRTFSKQIESSLQSLCRLSVESSSFILSFMFNIGDCNKQELSTFRIWLHLVLHFGVWYLMLVTRRLIRRKFMQDETFFSSFVFFKHVTS